MRGCRAARSLRVARPLSAVGRAGAAAAQPPAACRLPPPCSPATLPRRMSAIKAHPRRDEVAAASAEAPASAPRPWRKAPPQTAPPPDSTALNVEVRPESYDAELEAKVDAVRAAFAAQGIPLPPRAAVSVYPSEKAAFRQRAEFDVYGCRAPDERGFFAMNVRDATGRRIPVEISAFPFGSQRINALMPALLAGLAARDATLRRGVFQANFLTTRAGGAVVTLIYRRPLDAAAWLPDAEALRAELRLDGLVGRSRGQKLVAGSEAVTEVLEVGGKALTYIQMEDTFSQSNAGVAELMLRWAADAAGAPDQGGAAAEVGALRDDDLLELYCGSGNFTVALAPRFCRVLATEVSKAAVATAAQNLEANGVNNVVLGRVSAEELREAMEGIRPFTRLSHVPLDQLRLNTVLVDPPRAGCGAEVTAFLGRFKRVVYISCNPATMVEDIARLRDSHRVERFAVFDQFPYTPHVECGALLVRRAEGAGAWGALGRLLRFARRALGR